MRTAMRQNELTNVSTGTSKIVIDFKTYMDADSLDGIKLINKKTNTEVAVTAQKHRKHMKWYLISYWRVTQHMRLLFLELLKIVMTSLSVKIRQ